MFLYPVSGSPVCFLCHAHPSCRLTPNSVCVWKGVLSGRQEERSRTTWGLSMLMWVEYENQFASPNLLGDTTVVHWWRRLLCSSPERTTWLSTLLPAGFSVAFWILYFHKKAFVNCTYILTSHVLLAVLQLLRCRPVDQYNTSVNNRIVWNDWGLVPEEMTHTCLFWSMLIYVFIHSTM